MRGSREGLIADCTHTQTHRRLEEAAVLTRILTYAPEALKYCAKGEVAEGTGLGNGHRGGENGIWRVSFFHNFISLCAPAQIL